MSQYPPLNEAPLPVNRVEETVVTQQPGYAVTEQVVHDVAAERRLSFYQFVRILWTILSILELLLAIRFVLKLIAANPNSGFALFIYGITGPFMAPFTGLTATPTAGGAVFEITALIAMAIYALFLWVVVRLIAVAQTRPSARTITRSVHEQIPGSVAGSETERTTHTISNG